MRAAPSPARAVLAAAALLASACGKAPRVEPAAATTAASAAPRVTIESVVAAAADRKVVVTYRLTDLNGGSAITGAAADALIPSWTLAWLSTEPVTGLRAWRSLLLTGTQTAACLPPAGPGTFGGCDAASQSDPLNRWIVSARQPGTDSGGSTLPLGSGRFTYTFSGALPSPAPPDNVELRNETLRVGVNLRGAVGTPDTSTTFDFVPAGGTPASWALVRDESCNACHGVLVAHGRRTGVRFCSTCHTWQNADPDTIDPAALAPATRATFPNPMELGRLVHRIHRGKRLPTLFHASTTATWPAVPFTSAPPLPFLASRNSPADVGTKYSIVGYQSMEVVLGRVASRVENFQPPRTVVEGVGYPQDLRNCDACHAGAPERSWIGTDAAHVDGSVAISRRTCSGCHPDVFYGDPNDLTRTTPAPDDTHMAHTGGQQLNDGACKDCHVVAKAGGPYKLYAPISEIHRPLNDRAPNASPRWSRVTARITSVQNAHAGQTATVKFTVSDRNGSITPLDAPTVPMDHVSPTSPVPRRMTLLSLVLSGPTGDYVTNNVAMRASLTSRNGTTGVVTNAAGFSTADGGPPGNEFTYTFTTALPATAKGTWAIGIEGRRRPDDAGVLPPWDAATDTFNWPYTGETISEHFTNDVQYVDVGGTGAITYDPAKWRRAVVSQAQCEACHMELSLHGANRHDVAHCVLCHAPDATDWDKRPRDTRTVLDGGVVGNALTLLNNPVDPAATTKRWGYATLDGIEERSIHLKVMVHQIHVGERVGAASLEGVLPYVIYGNASATAAPSVNFFDDVRFPGKLANCELCHEKGSGTWTIESIPASALPTTANERGNLLHKTVYRVDGTVDTTLTAAHTATEPKRLPITATCLSCHTNGAAVLHAADQTPGGVEQCGSCHGESGAESVRKWHKVP